MNWVKIDVFESESKVDWVSERINEKGKSIEMITFTVMHENGLRIESDDKESFAFEIPKDEAIHLAKVILASFNCV